MTFTHGNADFSQFCTKFRTIKLTPKLHFLARILFCSLIYRVPDGHGTLVPKEGSPP